MLVEDFSLVKPSCLLDAANDQYEQCDDPLLNVVMTLYISADKPVVLFQLSVDEAPICIVWCRPHQVKWIIPGGHLSGKTGKVRELTDTVKPFMFACPLFCELNETAKLKGVKMYIVATSIGITHVLELCGLIRQIKRRQNNCACKIANF